MIKKKNISQKDINIWKNYIKNPTDITNKDNIKNNNKSGLNRFKYDLHGFTLLEANEKVREIILLCVQKKYKEILLITGKGIHSNIEKNVYVSKDHSTLKGTIPEFIKNNSALSSKIIKIENASLREGGKGALIIRLKKFKV